MTFVHHVLVSVTIIMSYCVVSMIIRTHHRPILLFRSSRYMGTWLLYRVVWWASWAGESELLYYDTCRLWQLYRLSNKVIK